MARRDEGEDTYDNAMFDDLYDYCAVVFENTDHLGQRIAWDYTRVHQYSDRTISKLVQCMDKLTKAQEEIMAAVQLYQFIRREELNNARKKTSKGVKK